MKLSSTLLKATGVGALGGLFFGFDTAVIAGTTHSLTLTYGLSPAPTRPDCGHGADWHDYWRDVGWHPGQRWGGRETLRILAIFYVLSALGCAFAANWHMLLGRPLHRRIWASAAPQCSVRSTSRNWRRRVCAAGSSDCFRSTSSSAFCWRIFLITHRRLGLGANEWRWEFGVARCPRCSFW